MLKIIYIYIIFLIENENAWNIYIYIYIYNKNDIIFIFFYFYSYFFNLFFKNFSIIQILITLILINIEGYIFNLICAINNLK